MQLRDYQQEAVYSVFRYFDKEKAKAGNPLILLPTGTGKSLVIAGLFELVFKWFPGQRVMMLTHVKELIEQNYDKLMKVWPDAPAGIYSAGLGRKDVYYPITFAGIASVGKQAKKFGRIDLIVVDECHLISPKEATMYKKFFAELMEVNPYLKIIGVTATGYRLGYGSIVKELEDDEALFDKVVFDATNAESFNWFIDQGYLLPVIPKRTKMQLDISGVGKSGGEYKAKELQAAVNRDDATEQALQEAIELGEDRQSWLIFCAGIEHAKDACDMLNHMGVSCGCIHSKLTAAERDETIAKFKRGEYRALTNNNVLTTGFDHPALDMIVMLRPTASTVLWVQMLGRGTRPLFTEGFDLSTQEGRLTAILNSPKQNCLVLDFSGNTRRLGPINDPVTPRRPGQKGAGSAPIKGCPECDMENHASARWCGGAQPINMAEVDQETVKQLYLKGYVLRGTNYVKNGYCGHEFKFQTKLKQAASTQELIKQDIPIVEDFAVTHVTYAKHSKRADPSKPPTLKVTYYCGSKMFNEWVCLMSGDWAGRKAAAWWRKRTHFPLPSSIDEALAVASTLKTPTHLKVHTNKKFPEILNYCYDGTCFGTMEASNVQQPAVQVFGANDVIESSPQPFNDDVSYDDIVAHNTIGLTPDQIVNTIDDPDFVPF